MGRIKTILVKRVTKQLLNDHFNKFTEDYTKNKVVLAKYASIKSPKIKNAVAGYAARLVKQSREDRQKRKVNAEDLSKFY